MQTGQTIKGGIGGFYKPVNLRTPRTCSTGYICRPSLLLLYLTAILSVRMPHLCTFAPQIHVSIAERARNTDRPIRSLFQESASYLEAFMFSVSRAKRLRVVKAGRTSSCCEMLSHRSERTCLIEQPLIAGWGKLGGRDPVKSLLEHLSWQGRVLLRNGPLHAGSANLPLDHSSCLLHHPRHAQTPTRKFSILRSFESPSREVVAEYGNQGIFQTLPEPA